MIKSSSKGKHTTKMIRQKSNIQNPKLMDPVNQSMFYPNEKYTIE